MSFLGASVWEGEKLSQMPRSCGPASSVEPAPLQHISRVSRASAPLKSRSANQVARVMPSRAGTCGRRTLLISRWPTSSSSESPTSPTALLLGGRLHLSRGRGILLPTAVLPRSAIAVAETHSSTRCRFPAPNALRNPATGYLTRGS
jgi:hypothetical protein